MPEPSEWCAEAGKVVDRVTRRWAVAGALAAERYRAAFRFTADADLLVEWKPELVEVLEAAGYELRVFADPGDHPHLIISKRAEARVDFLVATVPFQEEALDRAVDHFISPEDVIVFKLIAWRWKDRDDIASILITGRELDEGYIGRWAREFEVLDRWHAARVGRFA